MAAQKQSHCGPLTRQKKKNGSSLYHAPFKRKLSTRQGERIFGRFGQTLKVSCPQAEERSGSHSCRTAHRYQVKERQNMFVVPNEEQMPRKEITATTVLSKNQKETSVDGCVSCDRAKAKLIVQRRKTEMFLYRLKETMKKIVTLYTEMENSIGGPLRWTDDQYARSTHEYLENMYDNYNPELKVQFCV